MTLLSGNHFMKNRIKEIIAFTTLVIVVLAGLMNIAIIQATSQIWYEEKCITSGWDDSMEQ